MPKEFDKSSLSRCFQFCITKSMCGNTKLQKGVQDFFDNLYMARDEDIDKVS